MRMIFTRRNRLFFLTIVLFVVTLSVIWVDVELKPFDGEYARYLGMEHMIQVQLTADESTGMSVNACQTYGCISFVLIGLLAAQSRILLRTSMVLTRYSTWREFRWTTFRRLFVFGIGFVALVTALVQLAECTPFRRFLDGRLFTAQFFLPKAFVFYLVHMLLLTAVVSLYQTTMVFAHHVVLAQAFPMLALFIFGLMRNARLQTANPLSMAVYSQMPEGGLLRVCASYALLFGLPLLFATRERKEYLPGGDGRP